MQSLAFDTDCKSPPQLLPRAYLLLSRRHRVADWQATSSYAHAAHVPLYW